jgi:hypothetical protein
MGWKEMTVSGELDRNAEILKPVDSLVCEATPFALTTVKNARPNRDRKNLMQGFDSLS